MKLKFNILLFLLSAFYPLASSAQTPAELALNNLVSQAVKNFPVPPITRKTLFYLQRNKNANTVMYEANILSNGKLDPEKPVSVYWIRYTEGGEKKELNWIQRWMAYGVDFEPAKDGSGNFIITPVALKQRKIIVSVDKEGNANAYLTMNGKYARLNRIFAQAQETNWLPTVKFVQIKGEEVKTKQEVYEYIFPKKQ